MREPIAISPEEERKILANFFESEEPLRLNLFSPKEKKKIVILRRIAKEFSPGRDYSEKEINELLKAIYPDFATLRRALIDYGYLTRTPDGRVYRKSE